MEKEIKLACRLIKVSGERITTKQSKEVRGFIRELPVVGKRLTVLGGDYGGVVISEIKRLSESPRNVFEIETLNSLYLLVVEDAEEKVL